MQAAAKRARNKTASNSKMMDIVSLSVAPLAWSPVALWFLTLDTKYILLGAYTLAVVCSVEYIKRALAGVGASWALRPAGARDCSTLNRGGLVEYRPGFPSGHTTVAAFLSCVYLWNSNSWLLRFAGIGYVTAVAWSRMKKRCHTPAQVVAGGMYGVAAYWVWKQI